MKQGRSYQLLVFPLGGSTFWRMFISAEGREMSKNTFRDGYKNKLVGKV